jgi:hypothetical protein
MNLDMSNKVNSGSQTILLASGTNGDGNFSLWEYSYGKHMINHIKNANSI